MRAMAGAGISTRDTIRRVPAGNAPTSSWWTQSASSAGTATAINGGKGKSDWWDDTGRLGTGMLDAARHCVPSSSDPSNAPVTGRKPEENAYVRH
jgi:hypothetical protein